MSKSDKRVSDRVLMQNAVKTLAANIRFASVDHPVRTIVITSSVPNEGKSTIAIELASAMASDDKSVLLVECDMRRRNLAAMIGAHARHGIYSVLSGQVALSDAVVRTATPGVFFLDSEPNIPSPVDILSSHSFRSFVEGLGQDYDYVIFDTPPLSAFVDASVISSGRATAAELTEILSAPAFRSRSTSPSSRIPPPTVNGILISAATFLTSSVKVLRLSCEAVMSR